MLEGAVEKRRLGEYGDRSGAAALVLLRDRDRVVCSGKNSLRRRPPLALGDHVDAIRCTERRFEPPSARRRRRGAELERTERLPAPAGLDDPARRRHDRTKQVRSVAHTAASARELSTIFSS